MGQPREQDPTTTRPYQSDDRDKSRGAGNEPTAPAPPDVNLPVREPQVTQPRANPGLPENPSSIPRPDVATPGSQISSPPELV